MISSDLFCSPFLRALCLVLVLALGIGLSLNSPALAQKQKKETRESEIKQSTYAVLAEAPPEARERKSPFEGNPQAVAVGKKLFEQHCAECHGKNAAGSRKAPSLLRDEVQQATPGTLFWVVTNGSVRQGMPVWSKLPESQRWQIVSYVRSLTTHPSH